MTKINSTTIKYFAYVDESGQDTQGRIFVVSVLVLSHQRKELSDNLLYIEQQSGKKNTKWNKSRHSKRKSYIELLITCSLLRKSLFFTAFDHSGEYTELTSLATAKAILKKADNRKYKASVFVDGLQGREVDKFRRTLRSLYVKTRKIKGVKKDENNEFIRLVDALCGLIRDADDGNQWAKDVLTKLRKNKIVSEI